MSTSTLQHEMIQVDQQPGTSRGKKMVQDSLEGGKKSAKVVVSVFNDFKAFIDKGNVVDLVFFF